MGGGEKACSLTGITWQDHQHDVLLDLANKMTQAIKEKDNTQARTLAKDYLKFSREHFDLEEIYMAEQNYPDFDRHKAAHEKFIRLMQKALTNWELAVRSKELSNLVDADQLQDFAQVPDDLTEFLEFWHRQHCQSFDLALTEFLQSP